MSAHPIAPYRPGLRRGAAPARREPPTPSTLADRTLGRWLDSALGVASSRSAFRGRGPASFESVEARILALDGLRPARRADARRRVTEAASRRGHDGQSLANALAHACIAARETLGLTPHAGQRRAAHALLHGRFAELGTGEGKTLATALAAAVAALDGTPVHVLTANDYLAERDARTLAPFHAALGLSVACVLPGMDDAARRAAYRADVVHATAKQVAFDWMRDALTRDADPGSLVARLGELTGTRAERSAPLLRGLCRAFVDEADSLLVDEARVPLVLAASASHAGPGTGFDAAPGTRDDAREAAVALGLARLLREGIDYRLVPAERSVRLTDEGLDALQEHAGRVPGVWRAARYRNERVRQALAALHAWHRDRDYVVRDGGVVLVDAQTGRALPDRRLQHGLHALLEAKERCAPSEQAETVAALPFQRFFQGYGRLSGTSGTLVDVRAELADVYGGTVERVPPARPSRLRVLTPRVFATRAGQLDAMLVEVRGALSANRPVLVGTRTVEQSAGVSALLRAHGIVHRTLNAAQDADEAAVVAEAGRAGRVTVATNMAGRGTDIPLGPDVAAAGGLHVVGLAFNEARRLDRQLAGRAARQGDPGSYRRLVCLDDEGIAAGLPPWALALAIVLARLASPNKANFSDAGEAGAATGAAVASGSTSAWRARLAGWAALLLVRAARHGIERRHARERRLAIESGGRLARHLAIGGRTGTSA